MNIRKIIHIDMDAFFASVEQRNHPELQGKPIAIGSDDKRGVVSTASYEARKYGVHSAMSSVKAKQLCPELIFVSPNFAEYKHVSEQVLTIFHDYTDLIEPLSIDEAFLDVTENKKGINLAVDIANEIRTRIREELHLTASAGVASTLFVAKIASEQRKPDGICVIHPSQAEAFIEKLPIESFWGVGKRTAQRMHALGIYTGWQLKQYCRESLVREFGKAGQLFYNFARGIDSRCVNPNYERKSLGCECTLEKDQSARTHLIIELYHVTTELIYRLEKSEFFGATLTLKLKYSDFTLHTRSKTVAHPLVTLEEILPLAKQLLAELHEKGRPVRLIGLTISNQTDLPPKGGKRNEFSKSESDKALIQFELKFLPW